MKTKQTGIILIFLLLTNMIFAQLSVDEFVNEGVKYHDRGDYDKAIECYEKALKIEPKSSLVNYEIALSYFSKGDYKNSIKYSDVVLDQNAKYMIPAYLTKGSSLDMLGQTKKSIKLFEKAIKETEEHYLLYYNLAINYYNLNDIDNAEENVINAIQQNPNHASSHLMLATIHNQKGNSVQTLLAVHYFLFLEPASHRSVEAYQLLQENFGGNVAEDSNEPNTINVSLSLSDDTQFGAAEMMIALLEASKFLEENEGKTEDEMFIENTESFFTILGELKKKNNEEIWWVFYTTFFYDLANSEHLETYCKYITQIENEDSQVWLDENEDKLVAFDAWLKDK